MQAFNTWTLHVRYKRAVKQKVAGAIHLWKFRLVSECFASLQTNVVCEEGKRLAAKTAISLWNSKSKRMAFHAWVEHHNNQNRFKQKVKV
jgi:hypothetical protein